MSNKYLFPQKIYLENDIIIDDLNIFFDITNIENEKLKVGSWLSLDELKMKESFLQRGTNNSTATALNVCKNNESANFCTKLEYVVKPLDTFFLVAKKLNITETNLRKIAKTKNLYIGQKIVINNIEDN